MATVVGICVVSACVVRSISGSRNNATRAHIIIYKWVKNLRAMFDFFNGEGGADVINKLKCIYFEIISDICTGYIDEYGMVWQLFHFLKVSR